MIPSLYSNSRFLDDSCVLLTLKRVDGVVMQPQPPFGASGSASTIDVLASDLKKVSALFRTLFPFSVTFGSVFPVGINRPFYVLYRHVYLDCMARRGSALSLCYTCPSTAWPPYTRRSEFVSQLFQSRMIDFALLHIVTESHDTSSACTLPLQLGSDLWGPPSQLDDAANSEGTSELGEEKQLSLTAMTYLSESFLFETFPLV